MDIAAQNPAEADGNWIVRPDTARLASHIGYRDLPRFVRNQLAHPPRAGSGVHSWLFGTARVMHRYRSPNEIVALLASAVANCGRHVPPREIQQAVANSRGVAGRPRVRQLKTWPRACRRTWPDRNEARIAKIVAEGPGLDALRRYSPWQSTDHESQAERLIDQLFPGNPLLCVGKSSYQFDTLSRARWRGSLAQRSLIVPSPMTAPTGLTKDGRTSAHALSNTGPRRYLIVEFDQGGFDQHAAILWHLAQFGPLVLAVHSGNKSLHGWFACKDLPEDHLRRFFEYAVSLGADRATWTRSQFVRLPDGQRDNGARQSTLYFNPACLPV